MPRGQRNENAADKTDKKPRATVTPLEKAQQEAVRAFEKLASTREALEASKARTVELERQEAYQERLLDATQTHPDLPEGFNVVEFLREQEDGSKAEQDAADVEVVTGVEPEPAAETAVVTEAPAPAAAPVDDDDPFAGVS